MYYVTIPTAYIEGNAFNTNQFYKVQIRFDSYNGTDEVPINDEAKKNSYLLSHTQYFSEWSSVCLIRPIHQPKIYLSVFENYTGNSYMTFNKGLTQIAGGPYCYYYCFYVINYFVFLKKRKRRRSSFKY